MTAVLDEVDFTTDLAAQLTDKFSGQTVPKFGPGSSATGWATGEGALRWYAYTLEHTGVAELLEA